MVTACIDLGNTLRKAAVFEDSSLSAEYVFSDDLPGDAESFLNTWKPDRVILASVTDHPEAFEHLLASRSLFHKLSIYSKLNFIAQFDKPETIGPDRLALAAAAVDASPHAHNLVIALGSCITYNFIDGNHRFLGGAISPGLQMRFRSMHQHTAKLPLLSFGAMDESAEVPLTGYDTPSNMRSGVIHGMAFEIDGMINAYRERYENLEIRLTGGNAPYFAGQLKNRIFADSNLLFKGLYVLSRINIV